MAETTSNRHYPLPNLGHSVGIDGATLSDDLAVFQAALQAIDADITALLTALDGKAAADHAHAISAVTGLGDALAGKAAADHTHKLDDLSDVAGADDAPTTGTHALVKTPAGWVPAALAAILGDHSHTAAEITDLANVLAAYAKTTDVSTALGAYALLASPHFTGDPTAPTQSTGDNSTKLANTAFVQAKINATYTADDLLTKLLTVDGAGSEVDADLLDGQQGSYYANIPARLGYTPFSSAGGTISGHTILNSSSDATAISKGGGLGQLEIIGEDGRVAGISLHRSSIFACNLGIDTDNQLKIGGWSMGANSYRIWGEHNHGPGSGLNADMLDGQHASAFLTNLIMTEYAVGSIMFAVPNTYGDGGDIWPGTLVPGSDLGPAGTYGSNAHQGTGLSGTWKCLGNARAVYGGYPLATVWQRVA